MVKIFYLNETFTESLVFSGITKADLYIMGTTNPFINTVFSGSSTTSPFNFALSGGQFYSIYIPATSNNATITYQTDCYSLAYDTTYTDYYKIFKGCTSSSSGLTIILFLALQLIVMLIL
jgi:hypothetical protein